LVYLQSSGRTFDQGYIRAFDDKEMLIYAAAGFYIRDHIFDFFLRWHVMPMTDDYHCVVVEEVLD
jgi:hypothetical protein